MPDNFHVEDQCYDDNDKCPLSSPARYAKSMRLIKQFAFHLNEVPVHEYNQKFEILTNLLTQWRRGIFNYSDAQNESRAIGDDVARVKMESAF